MVDQANAENLPLEQILPAEDLRRWREEGVWTDAMDAAMRDCQQRDVAAGEAALEATVENIDEHMVAALEAKVRHIGGVLGEEANPLVASPGEEAEGLARLAQATEARVRRAMKKSAPVERAGE